MSQGQAQNATVWKDVLTRVAGGLSVRSDSRRVLPGEVFVALPGTNANGADYIAMALKQGAAFIVTQNTDHPLAGQTAEPSPDPASGRTATFIVREDVRQALGELAGTHYGTAKLPFPLAAITGTNGKTTVAYLVEHIIRAAGGIPGRLGTVEYRWPGHEEHASLTTPDCLALHAMLGQMIASGVTGAVMEASSHALAQDRLAGLRFDAAVFTNLTQDHLNYHKDMEDYFAAKRRLFTDYLKNPSDAVVNFDDPYGQKLLAEMPDAIGYGLGESALPPRALRGRITREDRHGMELQIHFEGQAWTITSPLAGRYNAQNLLAAQGAGLAMGLPESAFAALADCHGAPGRLERVPNTRGLSVFVDYAHTPDALENVQKALRELDFKRIVTVFGCGGDRDRTKRPLMAAAVAKWADVAVLTSDNPRHEDPMAIIEDARPGLAKAAKVVIEPDRREAIRLALGVVGPQDVLLVAGKGHEEYQQIGDVKHPFSDVAVVKELLK